MVAVTLTVEVDRGGGAYMRTGDAPVDRTGQVSTLSTALKAELRAAGASVS